MPQTINYKGKNTLLITFPVGMSVCGAEANDLFAEILDQSSLHRHFPEFHVVINPSYDDRFLVGVSMEKFRWAAKEQSSS